MTYRIQGEAPFQVLASNFSIGPSNEGYTLQISADGVNYSNLFSVGANVTRMVTGVANGSYYRLNGNNSIVSVNWERQCNDGGGGGGSSQYAESAGTANFADISNSTRLLDGVADFPQDANNGDVVAIGEDQRKGAKSGTKRPLPSTGIYQYDGSAWTPIGGETDFTSLMPVSSFPENPVAGEVVAIVEQPEVVESVNPTRGGAKSPVQPEEVSIYQYDGVNWNKIGGGEGSSAYKIELSTTNPEDFTEGDIVNLNAFFAAVMENPSTIDGAYIFLEDGNIYHISSAFYNERSGEGEFNFDLSHPNWIESIIIGYEMEEFSFAEIHKWEGNTLVPAIEFPQEPAPGEIANYDDGEGNVGLYQYDADNDEWAPFGGDNTILKHSDEMPVDIEVGDVYATHTDAEGVVIGDDWTDSGEQNIQYDRQGDGNPQAIGIAVDEGDYLNLGYAISEWDNSLDLTVGDGVLYTEDEIKFSGSGTDTLRLADPEWIVRTGGKAVVAYLHEGTVYFFTEDASLIWIYGVNGNETGNNVYEGTVTPSHPAFDDVYQAVEDESGNTVGSRLAKAKDIPGKEKLLPYWNIDLHQHTILGIDYWAGGPTWQDRTSVVNTALRDFDGYAEGKILKAIDPWHMKWVEPEKHNKIESVEELPERTKDGNVYAYASGGSYGIYQAQSGTPAQGWAEGTTEISGYTQIRVPYTASDTTYVGFAFEGYVEQHNLWWHYEGGENPHWDGDNVPIDEQVDGEFSGVDGDGVSISCVRDGDYLVVTFGEAISYTEEVINTEIYDKYVAPNYVEMATMDYVNNTLGNIETILQSI